MKKLALAAIAALCLSGHALAAKPGDALATVRIARQAIDNEMARRMTAEKGKPIRMDQPSGQQPSRAELAALKAVFGTEQPLKVKRTSKAGQTTTQYSATLPAIDYRNAETRITWPQIPWQYSVSGDTVDNTVNFPRLVIDDRGFDLTLTDIRSHSKQTRGSADQQHLVQVGNLIFLEHGGSGRAFADTLEMREQSTEQQHKIVQHLEFSARRVAFGNGVVLDHPHLDMHLHDLSANLWQQLVKAAAADQDDAILALLKPLLQQGARLELNDLSVDFGGGTLRMRGDLGMPGVTAAQLSNPASAFNALEAHLRVELPLATLRSFAVLATYHALKSPGEQVLDQPADTRYTDLLGTMIGNGYARLEKDKLVADIEIKHNQIIINGRVQPVTLSQFLVALHKQTQEPPEDDDTPPVALLWRDRSLDSLLLFANNGEWQARRELCRRYVLTDDKEQAERWCAKAGVPPARWKENINWEDPPQLTGRALRMSIAAGRYRMGYVRFDPSKTRTLTVKLSNPQAHDKWGPLLRVCVVAELPSDSACLSLTRLTGTDDVGISSQLYSVDDKLIGKEQIMAYQSKVGQPLTFSIHVDDKQAHFNLSGMELSQNVVFPASVISLMCSTADCDFSFD